MQKEDVLAILDGTFSSANKKTTGKSSVVLILTEEVTACATELMKLKYASSSKLPVLTLHPMQLPPLF
jgi:hypothetical protein